MTLKEKTALEIQNKLFEEFDKSEIESYEDLEYSSMKFISSQQIIEAREKIDQNLRSISNGSVRWKKQIESIRNILKIEGEKESQTEVNNELS
jgi:hypothetical protein